MSQEIYESIRAQAPVKLSEAEVKRIRRRIEDRIRKLPDHDFIVGLAAVLGCKVKSEGE